MQPDKIKDVMEKLRTLPPDRIEEVADFVDFLKQRAQAKRAAKREPLDFPVISVGQWPEDLSLRREDMYGDDGR
jgi:hypothetical protein